MYFVFIFISHSVPRSYSDVRKPINDKLKALAKH